MYIVKIKGLNERAFRRYGNAVNYVMQNLKYAQVEFNDLVFNTEKYIVYIPNVKPF